MSRIAITLALVVVMTACGDPLEGVGDLSRDLIHGTATTATTTTLPAGPKIDLKGITELIWVNDSIETSASSREEVVAAVWRRGDGLADFIQSSREEIAIALPGVQFPKLVPGEAGFVSSQLVFDTRTASLNVSTAAAFGIWSEEPYSVPRGEGQSAVLRVGLRTFAGEFNQTAEGEPEILTFSVTDGRELVWAEGDYVYQLFCRTGVNDAECFTMAESMGPLSFLTILPDGQLGGGGSA